MKTSVQFRNFNGLEHIQNYVKDSVDQSLGKFESWRQFNAHVILSMVRTRSNTHTPIFECEVLIKGKGLHRPVITKKTNSNFYQAFRSSLRAAEKILRRASKIRVTARRHLGHEEYVPADTQEIVA